MNETYTPNEVARLFKKHVDTIRTWVREGKLIPVKEVHGERVWNVFEKNYIDALVRAVKHHGK